MREERLQKDNFRLQSFRKLEKEKKQVLCIKCGKMFVAEFDVYTDAEVEFDDGSHRQYSKLSFASNFEHCPECRKIPKQGKYLYDLARFWRETDEEEKNTH